MGGRDIQCWLVVQLNSGLFRKSLVLAAQPLAMSGHVLVFLMPSRPKKKKKSAFEIYLHIILLISQQSLICSL